MSIRSGHETHLLQFSRIKGSLCHVYEWVGFFVLQRKRRDSSLVASSTAFLARRSTTPHHFLPSRWIPRKGPHPSSSCFAKLYTVHLNFIRVRSFANKLVSSYNAHVAVKQWIFNLRRRRRRSSLIFANYDV